MRRLLTKPGKHGTLYRYAVPYTDPTDPGYPPGSTWRVWAYSAAEALERFTEGDDGFVATGAPRTVRADETAPL